MTPEQVLDLVASGESETLEFKATTGTRREAVATVCAMLNQRGGHVLFGVSPDGAAVGQQVSERTLEELGAEIQRIDPPAFPEIERVRLSGGLEVVAVHVGCGASSPYQYRGASYRRVGNTTRSMLADEYNRMLFERMHSDRRWETEPAIGWAVQDLDLAELRNTVAEAVRVGRLNEPGSREPEDLLLGLGLIRDGVPCAPQPSYSGVRDTSHPRCRNASSAWRVSGVSIDPSSSTTASSSATPSRYSRVPSASSLTPFPLQAVSSPVVSSASTNRYTRRWPCAKPSRTPFATATTRWAAARSVSRSTTTAWKLRPPVHCTSA